jgi:excisionase family DNA binding protein
MPIVLLTGHELAKRLDVRYETVLSWARLGKIPSLKTGRGRVVFNLDQVVDALADKRSSAREGYAVVGVAK